MSVHPHGASDRRRLKRSADYFFTTKACARGEVATFAETLMGLGPVVAIGGFLRDLLLSGNRAFKSDVDFVVDPLSMPEFERMAGSLGAKPNRFGGYGITLSRWKVDVWPLERTWAGVNGHVPLSGLDDLVNVTFFDWDAVLYSVSEQRLIPGAGYFDRVRERVLDINLEPNPNPLGNAVRALRYAYRWDAAIGARLAVHVARQIRDNGWDTFLASERKSFQNPVLGMIDGDAVVRLLAKAVTDGTKEVSLPMGPLQHALPLCGGPAIISRRRVQDAAPVKKRRRPAMREARQEPALLPV